MLVALLTASCGATPVGDAPVVDGPPTDADGTLDGDWQLTGGEGPDGEVPLVDDAGGEVEVTLTIDGTSWSGQVCNTYTTEVTVDGTDLQVSPVTSTEMGCLDDGVTSAESVYLGALPLVGAHELDGDRLVLTGPGVRLVYDRDGTPPIDAAPLNDTLWQLDTLIDGEVASSPVGGAADPDAPADPDKPTDDHPVRAEELPDGTAWLLLQHGGYLGSTGCRDLEGTLTRAGDRLTLHDVASGAADGCDDALAGQDDHLLAVLTHDELTATVDGSVLTLEAGERAVAFRPATEP